MSVLKHEFSGQAKRGRMCECDIVDMVDIAAKRAACFPEGIHGLDGGQLNNIRERNDRFYEWQLKTCELYISI